MGQDGRFYEGRITTERALWAVGVCGTRWQRGRNCDGNSAKTGGFLRSEFGMKKRAPVRVSIVQGRFDCVNQARPRSRRTADDGLRGLPRCRRTDACLSIGHPRHSLHRMGAKRTAAGWRILDVTEYAAIDFLRRAGDAAHGVVEA